MTNNNSPPIVLRCGDCGRVAVMESPALTNATPLDWQMPAVAFCPDCMATGLRLMPSTVAPLNPAPASSHAA